jgi:HSP20 family protein
MKDLNSMRDNMERLLNESFVRFGGMLSSAASGWMPIDVAETGDGYVVWAAVPGVRPEDIRVTVQGSVLTISTDSRTDVESTEQNWIVRERRTGSSQRSVTIPTAVDPDRVEAKAENGLLVISLRKADAPPARTISVGGSTQTQRVTTSEEAVPAHAGEHGEGPDKVTDESEQSFPASDPPSWTPERA